MVEQALLWAGSPGGQDDGDEGQSRQRHDASMATGVDTLSRKVVGVPYKFGVLGIRRKDGLT